MNFDSDGSWDAEEQSGPAIHAPPNIKDIFVAGYRVEWLNISDPEKNFFAKNHMVATLLFAEPKIIDGTRFSSARLSMELGEEEKVTAIVAMSVRSPPRISTRLNLILIISARTGSLANSTSRGSTLSVS